MRTRPCLAALLLAPLAASAAAPAQTCVPHLLGADRRGPAHALARTGTTVYLGAGGALVVVDAADPLNPVELGFANLGGVVRDVAAWGATAVALVPDALELVDATDPVRPFVAGRFPIPPEWEVATVDARDALALFTAPDGLHLVAIADPSAPVELGAFAVAGAADVAARSGRAYLLAGAALHVLDTSDPSAPVQISQVPIATSAQQRVVVAPDGGRLATWGGACQHVHCWEDVAFFDLADPDLPVERSGFNYYEEEAGWPVALTTGYAYVGRRIYDTTDLANPVLVGEVPLSASETLGSPDGGHLLAAEASRGLRVYDVVPPAAAAEVAAADMPGATADGYFTGSLVVTLTEDGLRIFDVADPARPLLVGSLAVEASYPLEDILRVGSRAFVTSYGGVRTFDLTDPTQPVEGAPLGDFAYEPAVLDRDRLYVRDQCAEHVSIFDVSDPAAPLRVGAVHLSDLCYKMDFTVSGGRLYVWDYGAPGQHDLRVFDVSDPAAPLEIASAPMPFEHWARSRVRGRHLLLADYDDLRVLDISDPAIPDLVAELPLGPANWYRRRLDLYGSQLLVAPEVNRWIGEPFDDRLLLLDVSDPGQPIQRLELDTPGDARGVSSGPGRIGVADGDAGFSLYKSCVPFADGFERGDASAWSAVAP